MALGSISSRKSLNYLVIIVIILILVGTFTWAALEGKIFSKAAEGEATLSVTSGSQSYLPGQEGSFYISLDTGGAAIEKVNINALHYDKDLLEIIDADPSAPGTQITGDLSNFKTNFNLIDTAAGSINFEAEANPGTPGFSGIGRVAIVRFKTLKEGNANFKFDFEIGKLTDCNVIAKSNQADILTSAPSSFIVIVPIFASVAPSVQESVASSPASTPEKAKVSFQTSSAANATGRKISPFSLTPSWTLGIYVGGPLIVTLVIFYIWWRRRKKVFYTQETNFKGKSGSENIL